MNDPLSCQLLRICNFIIVIIIAVIAYRADKKFIKNRNKIVVEIHILIHAADARIFAVLNMPAYRRPEPLYAVLFVGVDPQSSASEIMDHLPWDSLHMYETSLASTVVFFTLEHDYMDRINSIDLSKVSPKAQMIIYKAPGEAEWTTRILLSRL